MVAVDAVIVQVSGTADEELLYCSRPTDLQPGDTTVSLFCPVSCLPVAMTTQLSLQPGSRLWPLSPCSDRTSYFARAFEMELLEGRRKGSQSNVAYLRWSANSGQSGEYPGSGTERSVRPRCKSRPSSYQ